MKERQGWVRTWEYSGDLNWPRNADRLPNGNTLIVDSRGDRVLEVTPEKDVVWRMDTQRRPYDIERLEYGDEPTGPPMHILWSDEQPNASQRFEMNDRASVGILDRVGDVWDRYYSFSGWVFPPWIHQSSFAALHVSLLGLLEWATFEWRRWRG